MGSWGTGPFENHDAADFAEELDKADPNERELLVRGALREALDGDEVEVYQANRAIAAAAVVAVSRPGAPSVDLSDGPQYLTFADEFPGLPDDLFDLARQAIERVCGESSQWRDEWDAVGDLDDATVGLDGVRAALG